jgi:hypothetical protein
MKSRSELVALAGGSKTLSRRTLNVQSRSSTKP